MTTQTISGVQTTSSTQPSARSAMKVRTDVRAGVRGWMICPE